MSGLNILIYILNLAKIKLSALIVVASSHLPLYKLTVEANEV